MKESFGWVGKILRVNLSAKTITYEPTESYASKTIGGRGMAQSILFDELDPSVEPLGPGNKVILGAGPLVGTLAPAAARLSVDWKNPQTGGVGSANVGGHFAPELKYAGFDSIVIEGQSASPVYLLIRDGEVQLHSASEIWGKTTWETQDILRQQAGDEKLRVACIGPAGENIVRGACLIVDRNRAAGRGGIGAVLGAKKLKAIAVRGTCPVNIYDPERFFREVERVRRKMEGSRRVKSLRDWGTLGASRDTPESPQPIRNDQYQGWPAEKSAKLDPSVFRDAYEVRRLACFNCSMYCSHFYAVKDGPYAGTACEGLEANTVRALGYNLDIDYAPAIVKGSALCNQLGIDVDFAGATMAWAFECYQRGVISAEDTQGLELLWGDYRTALELLEQIAHRQGFGQILAEGVKRASAFIAQGSEQWAAHIKGADLNEKAMRIHKGWALGIALATRGGGHLEGAFLLHGLGLIEKQAKAIFGFSDLGKLYDYEGKVKLLFWAERLKEAVDMLGICHLASAAYDVITMLGPKDCAALFTAATGVKMSGEELMRIGQRAHNVQKAFNTLHTGFGRQDDFPPYRMMTEATADGPYAGEILAKEDWDKALDDYYTLQGWDPVTGQQTETCLYSLGLSGVVKKLKRHGKL